MSATAKRPATVSCSFTRRGRPEVLWLVFIIVTAILIRETHGQSELTSGVPAVGIAGGLADRLTYPTV